MARNPRRGRTPAAARNRVSPISQSNNGSTKHVRQKSDLLVTNQTRGTTITGPPSGTSTIASGIEEEEQNTKLGKDRLQRFNHEVVDSVKHSFPQESTYDGCDDGPDFGDEGYDSPGSASSQACWHRSLTWWKE